MPEPAGLPELRAALGRRLCTLRARAGLTQEAAASRMGITARHLQRVEGGGENPSLETLYRIGAVYGLTVAKLLDLDEAEDPGPALRRERGRRE